ncbi:MAG: hypothetical protein J6B81_03145 [Spirochaetaceae bacterium]|nr:hypothetical protein [Spirochaetaceae bacterium]
MAITEYRAIILIPHDNIVSEITNQHRKIITVAQKYCTESCVFPFYMPHCFFSPDYEIKQLKKDIKSCKIEEPKYTEGIFIRPVLIEGATVLPTPVELMPYAANKRLPGGFAFGYGNNLKLAEEITLTMNQIKPINLRVFKLYEAIYSIQNNNHPSFFWKLQNEQWVKIK